MVWADHRGPLRASVRAAYGIDLRDPCARWDDLADLVAALPPGCALWRATGGPLAWSDETHALMGLEHGVRVLAWQQTADGHKGTNQPRPVDPPPLAAAAAAEQSTTERRAARYMDRRRRADRRG